MEKRKENHMRNHSSNSLKVNLFAVLAGLFVSLFFVNGALAASGVIVNAGGNREVNQTQSIVLSASAYDVSGLPLAYSWSCTGGSLSSSSVLSPVYYAPPAIYNTSYSCTLRVTNGSGLSSSDTITILVKGTVNGGSYSSNYMYANLTASPYSGTAPLTVSLTANAIGNIEGPVLYKFDCNDDGNLDAMVQGSTTYTAYDLCKYYTKGTYTAGVTVENNGRVVSRSINIIVSGNTTTSSRANALLDVDAGSNIELGAGQKITLNGSYFDANYYSVTANWSCTGGNLSNPYSLNPTYTAPAVSADTTYICTLYATNNKGASNSDSISVMVRKAGSGNLNATTGSPASVSTTTAMLQGTIVNDGGMGVAARFEWGKDASYGNKTDWSYNNKSGSTVTSLIAGLDKGKAYHYRIEIYNRAKTFKGNDMVFVTRPDSPVGVIATAVSSSQIKLVWGKGSGTCYSMVVRNKNDYPANTADGAVAYYGTANSFIDKNLSSNTEYFYKVWSVGCGSGLYSFSDGLGGTAKAVTYEAVAIVPVAKASGTVSTPSSSVVGQAISGIIVQSLARNITQGEIDWQNAINANPGDEIEFNIVITPSGGEDLKGVNLESIVSDKVGSFSDIKVGSSDYKGDIKSVSVGTIAIGNSEVVTFRGRVADGGSFEYGSSDIESKFNASADNNTSVGSDLTITVTKGVSGGASLIDMIGKNGIPYIAFSLLLFIMVIIIFYLVIDRRKMKKACVPVVSEGKSAKRSADDEVVIKKSKYFVIK